MSSSISVSSWIRKRFDSTESDHNGQPIPESPEPQETTNADGSNKDTNLCTYETETETKSKGVAKVKTQWQRAVRKLSANSSGYGSNDPSPSGSRTSIEKPAWALKQHYQPRSRHMSINVDNVVVNSQYHPKSCAQPIPESRPVHYQRSRFHPSSLPPYAGQMPMSPPKHEIHHHGDNIGSSSVQSTSSSNNQEKSRTPSGSSSNGSSSSGGSEEEKLTDEFPYGPAFRAAMGRVTAFPDGTEAVMIDSALALDAFRIDELVMIFMTL